MQMDMLHALLRATEREIEALQRRRDQLIHQIASGTRVVTEDIPHDITREVMV